LIGEEVGEECLVETRKVEPRVDSYVCSGVDRRSDRDLLEDN
jgi:hypothetical protein